MNILIRFIVFIICLILFITLYYSVNPQITLLSKAETLDFIRSYCPEFFVLDKNNYDLKTLECIKYPVIFKPDYCHNFAHGVQIIKSKEEAEKYIEKSIDTNIIVQEFHKGPFEATVLYYEHPIVKKPRIVVVERLPSENAGENWLWKSSVLSRELNFSSKHNPELQTQKLTDKFKEISDKIPNFGFGRYDIRFSSHYDLMNGENFKILELNENPSDTRYNENNSILYNSGILFMLIINRLEFGLIKCLKLDGLPIHKACLKVYKDISKIFNCEHEFYFRKVTHKMYINIEKNLYKEEGY